MKLFLTLSLIVSSTYARVVDVNPTRLNDEINNTPYALVHIHNGRKDYEDLERIDIDVFASSDGHPDFPLARSDLFAVVRGIVAPYVGNKSKDMLVYLADRLPMVYEPLEDVSDAPMTLINGVDAYDAQALEWCIRHPELTCVDAPDGPLNINGVVWDGTDGERWLRRQLVPPVVHIDDADLGLRLFDTHLFVLTDDESILAPLGDFFRDELVTIHAPIGHPFFDIEGPGAIYVKRNRTNVMQEIYEGEMTVDNLKDFVATI